MSKGFMKRAISSKSLRDTKDLSLYFFRTVEPDVYRISNFYVLSGVKAVDRISSKVHSLKNTVNAVTNYCKDNDIDYPWYCGYVNYVAIDRIRDLESMIKESVLGYRPSPLLQLQLYAGPLGHTTITIDKIGTILAAETTHVYRLDSAIKGAYLKEKLSSYSKFKTKLVFDMEVDQLLSLLDLGGEEISLDKFKLREELKWELSGVA